MLSSSRSRWVSRNLARYVLVVLPAYGLAGATIDALTGARSGTSFLALAGLWAIVGWCEPTQSEPHRPNF